LGKLKSVGFQGMNDTAEKGIEVRQKIEAILTSSQRTQMHKRLMLLMKKD